MHENVIDEAIEAAGLIARCDAYVAVRAGQWIVIGSENGGYCASSGQSARASASMLSLKPSRVVRM